MILSLKEEGDAQDVLHISHTPSRPQRADGQPVAAFAVAVSASPRGDSAHGSNASCCWKEVGVPKDDVLRAVAYGETVVAVHDVVVLEEKVRSTGRKSWLVLVPADGLTEGSGGLTIAGNRIVLQESTDARCRRSGTHVLNGKAFCKPIINVSSTMHAHMSCVQVSRTLPRSCC